ncbi:GNAT family N-acetyltransferase [Flavilitoribacter nigricans]|uniref:GNAT family N-acetyltransferase n=1 Tax=Flavilitoribacter nigricans (strain ATCC 23147 / DSM 23189 / NBRC 102662 / NCIMB 1420 / SS-2) TaxID=1122177 RepID=A0A2D0NI46_FLAN2|nr:GNAT family N-acetyltransferase [Flavilitoribacter nigricans]PHN08137.1 GNAT family N-acetyltransferase [Flavilitoribacter nigricans DSM 23189 = NBRC 102662]
MANSTISAADIRIRTEIKPGDIGFVIYRHGVLYAEEYNYGFPFELYVAKTVHEFYQHYDPARDRTWVCEHEDRIIGFLVLQHRENNTAQLRYFYLEKAYRGIGLGKKLMDLYMAFYRQCGYDSTYLWTAHEHREAAALYLRYGFSLTEEAESTTFGRKVIERKYELQ